MLSLRPPPLADRTPSPSRQAVEDHARGDCAATTIMRPAGLHEFYAATEADASACACFALALHAADDRAGDTVWIRARDVEQEAGAPYAPGLAALGLDPSRIILVRVRDVSGALQAGLEAARCPALAGVVVEMRGRAPAYDLTASRRLTLASRAANVRICLTRSAARPVASAADTRWEIRAAPSTPLAANAPGAPAFDLRLLRHRNGREALDWIVEWNSEERRFVERLAPAASSARLPSSARLASSTSPALATGAAHSDNRRDKSSASR